MTWLMWFGVAYAIANVLLVIGICCAGELGKRVDNQMEQLWRGERTR
jgi:hypothetical protein